MKTVLSSKLSSVLTILRYIDSANVIQQAEVVDFWNLFQLLSQEKALPLKLQARFLLRIHDYKSDGFTILNDSGPAL